MRNPKKKTFTKQQLAIRSGDWVWVDLDSGETVRRQAISDPWQLGHGDWVIKLDGISGGFCLTRCTKIVHVSRSLFPGDGPPQHSAMIP